MKNSITLLAGGALLLASFAANANLITNSNFASGTAAGWASSGAVAVVSYASYGMPGASAGSNFGAAFGGGNAAATGVLSQTIATVAGVTYSLNFDYGAFGYNPSFVQSLSVLAVDGVSLGAMMTQAITTLSSTALLASLYSPYAYTFTAIGSSTVLSFSDTSLITNITDGFLTNVAVNAIAPPVTAVAVPGTLALLSLALVGLGLARRRMI